MTTSKPLHEKKYHVGDQHSTVTLMALETELWSEAYEASEEGDRPYALVTVDRSEGKPKYNVTVRDDGPSMPGEDLERVLGGALVYHKQMGK